jgi:hypothetical protein
MNSHDNCHHNPLRQQNEKVLHCCHDRRLQHQQDSFFFTCFLFARFLAQLLAGLPWLKFGLHFLISAGKCNHITLNLSIAVSFQIFTIYWKLSRLSWGYEECLLYGKMMVQYTKSRELLIMAINNKCDILVYVGRTKFQRICCFHLQERRKQKLPPEKLSLIYQTTQFHFDLHESVQPDTSMKITNKMHYID